jgi:hypothetical protein
VSTQPEADAGTDCWQALTTGLIDDAAVFPPRREPVSGAVEAHRRHRRAWYADLVGPLIVRASDAAGLLAATRPGDDLRIGLVASADGGLAELVEAVSALVDADDRVVVANIEMALPSGFDVAAGARTLIDQLAFAATTYVEVPRSGFEPALDVLADDGAERAKYRTGGLDADAFPTEAELASFVTGCASRGVTFKLTAGLHHAIRNTSPEGFEQHGVLNVLAATAAAAAGESAGDVAGILAARDPAALVDLLSDGGIEAVGRTRRLLSSFGCCDVTDPIADLVDLGLLATELH